jgi:hypothetical protein
MNYKEMLDKFEYLEQQLAHLENENKYIRERLARLEYPQQYTVKGPSFTPGTMPAPQPLQGWTITCTDNTQGREFQ